jgi:PAT family beta-lactamase induction signal transducer AmpG
VEPNPSAERRAVHPVLFFFLYFGFGAPGGFLTGTIELFYTNAGVSTQAFGLIVSIALAAQVLKVFWAPLVDTTLNVKAWYLLALAIIIPCLLFSANLHIGPASAVQLGVLSLVVSIASSFLGMAADSLMAHDTAPERRGAAGGWSQAGNLGGSGLGGAAGLWVANHFHSVPISGMVVAVGTAACALALLFAPKTHAVSSHANYLATLRLVVADCWQVCRARAGWLTLVVLVLPLGAGGAAQLASGLSKEWRVNPDLLAGVNGLSGLVVAAAALVGGYICDRIDRKSAYVLFGVLGGAICAAIAFMPRTPEWFVVLALAYSAALGMSYAAFSATTLEAIGGGAAATKYTLFASISNIPVALMPALDGWADTRWNAGAVLWIEFGTAVAAALIFMLVAVTTRPRRALTTA